MGHDGSAEIERFGHFSDRPVAYGDQMDVGRSQLLRIAGERTAVRAGDPFAPVAVAGVKLRQSVRTGGDCSGQRFGHVPASDDDDRFHVRSSFGVSISISMIRRLAGLSLSARFSACTMASMVSNSGLCSGSNAAWPEVSTR